MRKPGRWFLDALESVQESKGSGRTDPGWFHPSDLSHTCDAYIAFKFLGAPEEKSISAKLQRIFDLGSARDKQLKQDAKRSGASIITNEKERKIEIPTYRIRGELDDIIEQPITKERFIVDYKTMNSKEWEALDVVKPSHHLQVHPYMFGKEIYNGLVLYENKNTQDHKIMQANFSNDIWQEKVTNRIERILQGIKGNFVNRMPIPNDSQCSFYHICSNANIAQLKEKIELP